MRRKRLIVVVLLLGSCAVYVLGWRNFDPRRADFVAWYVAARVWKSGGSVYDLRVTCHAQTAIRGDGCLPYNRPPILLPAISWVVIDDYVSSYNRWSLVLTLSTLGLLFPLMLLLRNIEAALTCLVFFPLYVGVVLGQETPFLVFGVLMWVWLMGRQKYFLSGLVLSLTALKPQFAVAIALPLLFAKPKAFAGCAIGCVALALLSFFLVGLDGMYGLVQAVIITARADSPMYIVGRFEMMNLSGMLTRLGVNPLWTWPAFILSSCVVGLLWKKSFELNSIALGILLLLFTIPHLHSHDLALLLVSLLTLSSLTRLGFLTIFTLTFGLNLEYIGIYLLMAMLAWLHIKELKPDEPANRKEVA